VAHSIDAIEEALPAATVVEDDLMVDLLEKEAVILKKKIEVEVDERGTVVNETEYSTTLIETKLKKMVAQIEEEIAKKDEELQIKKEKKVEEGKATPSQMAEATLVPEIPPIIPPSESDARTA